PAAARKAFENGQNRTEADNLLGIISDRQGNSADAEKNFREALKASPNSAVYRHNLGNALMQQKKQPAAIAEFEKALQIDPTHLNSHFMLGRAYSEQKRFDLAVRHLEVVRKLAPDDLHALFYLCEAYFKVGRDEAGLEVARDFSRFGADARIQFALGVVLTRNGHCPEAAKAFEQVVSKEPANPAAVDYLGVCSVEAGRPQEARKYFEKALAIDPNHALSSFELSNLLIREGQFEED